MKKTLIIIIILINLNGIASNKFGLTQDVYFELCGVWDTEEIYSTTSNYSWGKAKEEVNRSLVIDLGADEPFLLIGGAGKFKIIQIKKSNRNYKMIIKHKFDNFGKKNEYVLKFKVVNDGAIIFNEMDHRIIQDYRKYHKIDGPSKTFYKSKVNNLRLRVKPILNSKILRLVGKDEKVIILKKGATDIIDKVKGKWVKVLTEKNEIGWCFDYYLELI